MAASEVHKDLERIHVKTKGMLSRACEDGMFSKALAFAKCEVDGSEARYSCQASLDEEPTKMKAKEEQAQATPTGEARLEAEEKAKIIIKGGPQTESMDEVEKVAERAS